MIEFIIEINVIMLADEPSVLSHGISGSAERAFGIQAGTRNCVCSVAGRQFVWIVRAYSVLQQIVKEVELKFSSMFLDPFGPMERSKGDLQIMKPF